MAESEPKQPAEMVTALIYAVPLDLSLILSVFIFKDITLDARFCRGLYFIFIFLLRTLLGIPCLRIF